MSGSDGDGADGSLLVRLAHTASTPRAARRAVGERYGGRSRCGDLILCVSELITNAVIHAASAPTMTVSDDGRVVRVEVTDGDRRPPVVRDPDPSVATGRGLRLLDALAVEWGWETDESGKTVWFTFDLEAPEP